MLTRPGRAKLRRSNALPASPIRRFKPSGLEGNVMQNEPAQTLLRNAGPATETNIGRTYPSRLHDIQDSPSVPDQSRHSTRTTDRVPVDIALPQGQDMTVLPISERTALLSRIPSLLNFDFPDATVSQPTSFVRPALQVPSYTLTSPCENGILSRRGQNISGFTSTEMDMVGSSVPCKYHSPSYSHEPLSPQSLSTSLQTSGTPRNHGGSPDSIRGAGLDEYPDNSIDGFAHTKSSSCYARLDTFRSIEEYRTLSSSEKKWHIYLTSVTDHYGIDRGRPDLDLGNNDDHSAIDVNDALDIIQSYTTSQASSPGNHQADKKRNIARCNKHDYYAWPVSIDIPRYLSPLPPSLLKVPINLMYFHHFLNHTARVLVPHDCGNNPFSSVLPAMAIGDSNLLNLMLAYSASHRARFLGQPEPANRIAFWVSNVFPSLRVALEDPRENITDSHLATAIMLLSLKIVSPSTFEVPVPWQSHLQLARDLFLARRSQMAYPGNNIGAFLTRWLGYLDILGSLSCRHHQPPLQDYYSMLNIFSSEEDWDESAVDCFTGFSHRTGMFLMRLGSLVYECDNERFDDLGIFMPEWKPSPDMVWKAEALRTDWRELDMQVYAHEEHYRDSEASDMIAIDRAFRYAGLLHLHRRALGEASDSFSVQRALDGLIQAVTAVPSGAAAEVGVLFPIFTAGCESQDIQDRVEIQERLENLERTGMKQVQNARLLMQRCWGKDLPWIAVALALVPLQLRFFPKMEGCNVSKSGGGLSAYGTLLISLLLPIFVMLCVFMFFVDTRVLSLTRSSVSGHNDLNWRRREEEGADDENMADTPMSYSTDLLDDRIEDIQIPPLCPEVITPVFDENTVPSHEGPDGLLDSIVDKLKIPPLEPTTTAKAVKWDGRISWALNGPSVFDDEDEEYCAFNVRSNLITRQPSSELWVFQYGLRYIPSQSDHNIYRTIRIEELPRDISLTEILPLAVGEIYCARLMDTMALTGYNTALITYVTENGALKFMTAILNKAVTLPAGKVVPVHTPTYPIAAEMGRLIEQGNTRSLAVSHYRNTLKAELTRILTRPDLMFNLQIETIDEGPEKREVTVKMLSVKAAASLLKFLQEHPSLHNSQFRFLKQDSTLSRTVPSLGRRDVRGHNWR
ncbi:fungal-specific transcription factor domain-containing protein [Aspergillus egyptiacus]|nr:fungal-specific transcription factor domain-containing protein [Aspergillus egyptiacus]